MPASKVDDKVPPPHSAASPRNRPTAVTRQLGYHWKKVKRHATTGDGKRNKVAVTARPVTLDLTCYTRRVDASVQTDLWRPKRPASSTGSWGKMVNAVPEWFWTGHKGIPAHLPTSVPIGGLKKSASSAFVAAKKSVAVRRAFTSLGSLQEAAQRVVRRSSTAPQEEPETIDLTRGRAAKGVEARPRSIRRGSIMDQVEAKRAPSRNAIKRQMVQQFHQGLTRLSSVDVQDDMPCSPPEQAKRRSPPPRAQFQRSFTLDSFMLSDGNSEGERKQQQRGSHWLPSRFISLGLMESEEERRARRLRKMWEDAYLGMCNRAAVLNHVIDKADKEEVSVKPLSSSKKSEMEQDAALEKKKRLFMGLSEQFYHVDQDECESSESSEAEDNADQTPFQLPTAVKARIKELPCTEEVILVQAPAQVRLNLRSRSVDCLYLDVPSARLRRKNSASSIIQGPRSVVDVSSPSRIPRLSKSKASERKGGELKTSGSGVWNPTITSVVDAVVKKFRSHLNHESTVPFTDASTQVTLPPVPLPYSPRAESPDSRPVERQVEARTGSEDGLGSMVRCLHFAQTYIANRE